MLVSKALIDRQSLRITDTEPLQRQTSGNIGRESLIGDRDSPCGRAKPGRFGSLAFAMKIGISGDSAHGYQQEKHESVADSGCFVCVPNPSKQSIWRQCPPSARKQSTEKMPNRPFFPMCKFSLEFTLTPLQIQTSGSKEMNSVKSLATTVCI